MKHCPMCALGAQEASCLECNHQKCRPTFQACSGLPCTTSNYTTLESACVEESAAGGHEASLLKYWDGQCKLCPATLYKGDHCLEGGKLIGMRACGIGNLSCEGQCQYLRSPPVSRSSFHPEANDSEKEDQEYWDGQCTPCPAELYSSQHCLDGGKLVGERACGPWKASCEGRCRLPQSSRPPTAEFHWSGHCVACPARMYSHCPRGSEMVGERYCGALPPVEVKCEARCRTPPPAPEPADWIIIGGGASGSAAAAALVDAGHDVLLLERGQSDLDLPQTQQASTWPGVVNTNAAQMIQWTDGTWGSVARVLGGGTAVNGGLCIEEEPDFFTESFGKDFDLRELYESSRWLAQKLATPLQPTSYGRDLAEALERAGLGFANPDKPQLRWSNGAWTAYSFFNTSTAEQTRRGAAALLHERATSKHLRYFTQHVVKRIEFEHQRAVGVRYVNQFNDERVVKARKGVILAAGAIFTPQLLQISGVGDEALLSRIGVETVLNSPAVGQNFIDRSLLVFGVWASRLMPAFFGYAMAANTSLKLTFENEGWGKVASEFAIASIGLVPPHERTPAFRDALKILRSPGFQDMMNQMMQFVALHHETHSRGKVEAKSADAKDAPRVTANHFTDHRDLERQMEAVSELIRILESDVLQKYVHPKNVLPEYKWDVPDFLSCIAQAPNSELKAIVLPCLPPRGSSKDHWYKHFRDTAVSSYHYFGTAAFGSVVEGGDFRVKGLDNLHVVDASVFPAPTRVNPQCTIMALGHYAGKRIARGGAGRLDAALGGKDARGPAPPRGSGRASKHTRGGAEGPLVSRARRTA